MIEIYYNKNSGTLTRPWNGRSGTLIERTNDLVRLWNGRSDTLTERIDNPAELARALRIY